MREFTPDEIEGWIVDGANPTDMAEWIEKSYGLARGWATDTICSLLMQRAEPKTRVAAVMGFILNYRKETLRKQIAYHGSELDKLKEQLNALSQPETA